MYETLRQHLAKGDHQLSLVICRSPRNVEASKGLQHLPQNQTFKSAGGCVSDTFTALLYSMQGICPNVLQHCCAGGTTIAEMRLFSGKNTSKIELMSISVQEKSRQIKKNYTQQCVVYLNGISLEVIRYAFAAICMKIYIKSSKSQSSSCKSVRINFLLCEAQQARQ